MPTRPATNQVLFPQNAAMSRRRRVQRQGAGAERRWTGISLSPKSSPVEGEGPMLASLRLSSLPRWGYLSLPGAFRLHDGV